MISCLAKEKFGDFESYEVLERTFERRKLKEFSLAQTREDGPEDKDNKEAGDQPQAIPRGRGEEKFVFSQPNEDGRWHTGYLTFCTKF